MILHIILEFIVQSGKSMTGVISVKTLFLILMKKLENIISSIYCWCNVYSLLLLDILCWYTGGSYHNPSTPPFIHNNNIHTPFIQFFNIKYNYHQYIKKVVFSFRIRKIATFNKIKLLQFF